ncbi:serine hydrolase domain-containing protein [Streptacidiphilus anmyonensis]|uniref:serine hydrolase domain-containing protein n=1 Tax=Streptacidiphilus anmyonensis TaxID=405782 RepID=UPI001F359CEF|nr:serine hydrolase domain-containing protein [Streptacidiphilus anmyonensis]
MKQVQGPRRTRLRGLLAAACAAAALVPFATAPAGASASAGAVAVRSAAADPGGADGLSPALETRLDRAIRTAMRTYGIPGAVVGAWLPGHGRFVRAFGVADEKTGEPMRTDVNTRIGSVTKTFTVTALLELVDQGRVHLDDPISKYVAGVPEGHRITLRDLADMRSGLYPYTADNGFERDFLAHPTRSFTPQQLLSYGYRHPNLFPPGSQYLYSNSNTVLLGLVIEKLTHTSLSDDVGRRVIAPSDLDHSVMTPTTYLPRPRPHGYTAQTLNGTVADATGWSTSWGWADADMVSDLKDLHDWAYDLYRGTLLSRHTQAQRLRFIPTGQPGLGYGLGVADFNGWIGHNGEVPGYETVDVYLPSERATLVVMVNTDVPYQGNVANAPGDLLATAVTSVITPKNVFP